jgi:hypothetical protein
MKHRACNNATIRRKTVWRRRRRMRTSAMKQIGPIGAPETYAYMYIYWREVTEAEIALSVRWLLTVWITGIRFQKKVNNFSVRHLIYTDFGAIRAWSWPHPSFAEVHKSWRFGSTYMRSLVKVGNFLTTWTREMDDSVPRCSVRDSRRRNTRRLLNTDSNITVETYVKVYRSAGSIRHFSSLYEDKKQNN